MSRNGNVASDLVKQVENLPPMPSNVVKLRRAMSDPNINYDKISPILKEDPSICADILRIANSARYGVGHKVETIDEGVRYFGMSTLVDFVAAACSEKIIKKSFAKVDNLTEYLNHSRKVSVASPIVGRKLGVSPHDQEVYSITGLLHDIGRLVILLVTEQPFHASELLGSPYETMREIAKNEKELLGLDHAELGMRICDKWLFPEKICHGVHRHHSPINGSDISFDGMIIFLAEVVSFTDLPESILEMALPPEMMQKMNIDPSMLVSARNDFIEEYQA